jgi:hypothetical protein
VERVTEDDAAETFHAAFANTEDLQGFQGARESLYFRVVQRPALA